MTRRAVLALVIDWVVIRRHAQDDLKCMIDGRRKNQAALIRDECVFVNGRWRSGKAYAQDV